MMQCSRGTREGGGEWACFSAANSLAKGSNMSSPSPTLGGKQAREGLTDRTPMNSTIEVTGNKLDVSYTLRKAEQNKYKEKKRKERGKRKRKRKKERERNYKEKRRGGGRKSPPLTFTRQGGLVSPGNG